MSPASGRGPAELAVEAAMIGAETDRVVTVSVDSPHAGSTRFDVRIRTVAGGDRPPFGFVDAPADPIALGEAPIVLQGWALDDTSMKRVWVGYRDASGTTVPLGEANRDGHRPDVAKAFPTGHDLFKAAWAFTLTPAMLSGIPRPVQLHVMAEDSGGRRSKIGERTVR